MSTLRAYRLLGSIEAGNTSSLQLDTLLTGSLGRSSEFAVLFSTRGNSRRMANSPLTISIMVGSQAAIDIIFKTVKAETSAACQAITASNIAMSTVGNNKPSLLVIAANSVAWSLFIASAHYETNIRTILALYAGVTPANYTTVAALINGSVPMAAIAAEPNAMYAVVASAPTTTLMAASSAAMSLVASDNVAIDIVAKQTSIMSIIAASTPAMTEIISRSAAVTKMASYPGAIAAISKVATAWNSFLAGSYFATNLSLILANLIGVAPTSYPTLDSVIADATALAKVAANTQAVQALSSNSAAMTTLSNSSNIGIVLASSTAMGVIGISTSAMTSFLNSSGAWAGLFGSSVAKGYIVASTTLVNVVAANSSLITYLNTIAVKNVSATGIPDGNPTSLQAFVASPVLPSKLMILSAKEVGIAATYSNYNFGGSSMTGSQAGATLSLSGTGAGGQPAHIAGYTGLTWNFQGPGITAATLPIITYVDMT